jgi:hypothetical protein
MDDATMRAFGASDAACYKWPNDTEHDKACRAAYIQGAADASPMTFLWCCHIRGPDDVHAAPDYETAVKWADITNALNWRGLGGKIEAPTSYDDCLLKAVPAPWPWSAEKHAEDLPKSIAGYAPRGSAP